MIGFALGLLSHVHGDEETEEQDQRHGDQYLRGEPGRMVVHACLGLAADAAASFDDWPRTMCADEVLTAHLYPFRLKTPRVHLE
jgi:hypothetical protein